MKVIFLDVDGVLNNMDWASSMRQKNVMVFSQDLLYEPALLMLEDLVRETDAILVLSSAWRKIPSAREALVKQLAEHNMQLHSDTPYVGDIRGKDIDAWFNHHPEIKIDSYVILDDDSDFTEAQLPYLVQTDFADGLQDRHYRRAKAILNQADLNSAVWLWDGANGSYCSECDNYIPTVRYYDGDSWSEQEINRTPYCPHCGRFMKN